MFSGVSDVVNLPSTQQLCGGGKKKSAIPGGQKVGPDIERLIGHLEKAQDAVGGWAAGVPVPRNNAVLMENLSKETRAVSTQSQIAET